jgi:peptidase E
VAHAKKQLKDFLREQKQNVIFIPYAVVTFLFDEKVNRVFDKVVGLQEGTMLQRNENNNQITII